MNTPPRAAKTRVNRESTGPRIDQAPTSGSGAEGPLERLTRFHAEIREATAALTALLDAASKGALARGKAQHLREFFAGPLLWHDEDEEVGLFPRLRRVELSDSERAVIDATSRGHDRMEELLEHLGPLVAAMADGKGDVAELAAGTAEARALQTLLDDVMKLEEEALFPLAAKRLSHADLEELADEMDARHGDEGARPRRAVEL
ncbi:MAG: hemerythrin domain-containing protein [Deltaproteobacteria bacterium]|nr:hemerythrin domain-containing protein [Deltaproteobacteria bacterium]